MVDRFLLNSVNSSNYTNEKQNRKKHERFSTQEPDNYANTAEWFKIITQLNTSAILSGTQWSNRLTDILLMQAYKL